MVETNAPVTADYPSLAVLHNATHEPHFHVTSSALAGRDAHASGVRGRVVARHGDTIAGMASFSTQDFDRSDRLWVDLAIHPDHRGDETTSALMDAIAERVRDHPMTSYWLPVREDYLDSWPDMTPLGFEEVHRTFGGGFFLADGRRFDRVTPQGVTLVPVLELAHTDVGATNLRAFYADVRDDKVIALPTIPSASRELILDDALPQASFAAMHDGSVIGLSVAERSELGAWHSLFAVRSDMRRRGIARALLTATLSALQADEILFLNTAGVRSDDAYLGLLRSLGATIEPDWIAFERRV